MATRPQPPRPQPPTKAIPPVPTRMRLGQATPSNIMLKQLSPATETVPRVYSGERQPAAQTHTQFDNPRPKRPPVSQQFMPQSDLGTSGHVTAHQTSEPAQEQTTKGPSIFDVTQRDADKFKATADQNFEDHDEDTNIRRLIRAREYSTCIKVVFWISVVLCLWPFSWMCLCIAYITSNRTAERNNEKDYLSAQSCSQWSFGCIILAIIFIITLPVIVIVFFASIFGPQ